MQDQQNRQIYNRIVEAKKCGEKLFAVLVDPEKQYLTTLSAINHAQTKPDFILVGGSQYRQTVHKAVEIIKSQCQIPVVLFPGDCSQLTDNADALLLISLISGKNPEYLIGQHIASARKIIEASIETISTGYILIDGGTTTAVERISKTTPYSPLSTGLIVDTALAAYLLGQKAVYLEAGSGAKIPVDPRIISEVSRSVPLPIIVGGGIKTPRQVADAYNAGADIVVIGNHFETVPSDILPITTEVARFKKTASSGLIDSFGSID